MRCPPAAGGLRAGRGGAAPCQRTRCRGHSRGSRSRCPTRELFPCGVPSRCCAHVDRRNGVSTPAGILPGRPDMEAAASGRRKGAYAGGSAAGSHVMVRGEGLESPRVPGVRTGRKPNLHAVCLWRRRRPWGPPHPTPGSLLARSMAWRVPPGRPLGRNDTAARSAAAATESPQNANASRQGGVVGIRAGGREAGGRGSRGWLAGGWLARAV